MLAKKPRLSTVLAKIQRSVKYRASILHLEKKCCAQKNTALVKKPRSVNGACQLRSETGLVYCTSILRSENSANLLRSERNRACQNTALAHCACPLSVFLSSFDKVTITLSERSVLAQCTSTVYEHSVQAQYTTAVYVRSILTSTVYKRSGRARYLGKRSIQCLYTVLVHCACTLWL